MGSRIKKKKVCHWQVVKVLESSYLIQWLTCTEKSNRMPPYRVSGILLGAEYTAVRDKKPSRTSPQCVNNTAVTARVIRAQSWGGHACHPRDTEEERAPTCRQTGLACQAEELASAGTHEQAGTWWIWGTITVRIWRTPCWATRQHGRHELLDHWFSKWVSLPSSINITWEFIRNTNSQAPPQT